MEGNTLSFSVIARDGASPALRTIQRNIASLKSGIQSIGSSSSKSFGTATSSTTNFLNSLNNHSRRATSTFGSLGSIVKKVIGSFGGFRIVNGMINTVTGTLDRALTRADTMQLFDEKIALITQDTEAAGKALEHLKESTKGTPYALDIAAKAVQNFVTRGMETEKATDSVDIWMDAVSAYGNGTNEQFNSVLDAIAKMRTKGTVEMRYLNRLFAAGINPVQMYAKATGQAAEDVQTALSEKTIKTEDFLNVVETAMREGTNGVTKIQGAAKSLATTWAATLANMQAAMARGWVNLLTGADTFFNLFNEKGLKGVISNYGKSVEAILTSAGTLITNSVNKAVEVFNRVKGENPKLFETVEGQISAKKQDTQARVNNGNTNFNNVFKDNFNPFLTEIIKNFEKLRLSWEVIVNTFAKGWEVISGPLAKFTAVYLGEAITGIQKLGLAFAEWFRVNGIYYLTRLADGLTWLVDHKDSVVAAAGAIVKALLAFNILRDVKGVIVNFNNSLKAMNDLLAFYTGGHFQLPTFDSMAIALEERNQQRQQQEVAIQQATQNARQRLTNNYVSNRNNVRDEAQRQQSQLTSSQLKEEIAVSKSHKKNLTKIDTDREKATDKINLTQSKALEKVDTDYIKGKDQNKVIYKKDIAAVDKKKDSETVKIIRSQQRIQDAMRAEAYAPYNSAGEIGERASESLLDYNARKTISKKDIETRGKLYDNVYQKMKENDITPRTPLLQDIYNRGENARVAQVQAGLDYTNRAIDIERTKQNKSRDIKVNAKTALENVDLDYRNRVDTLNANTKDRLKQTRDSYNAKKKSAAAQSVAKEVDLRKTLYKGYQDTANKPTPIVQKAKNWVATGWQNTKEATKTGAKGLATGTVDYFKTFVDGFKQLGNKKVSVAVDGVEEAAQKTNWLSGLLSHIPFLKPKTTVAVEGVEEAAQKTGFFSTAIDKLKDGLTTVGGFFLKLISPITSFLGAFGGGIVVITGAVAAIGALSMALGLLNNNMRLSSMIDQFFKGIQGAIVGFGDLAVTAINNFVNGIKQNASRLGKQGGDLIGTFVMNVLTTLPILIGTGAQVLFTLIGGILEALPSLVEAGFSAIIGFIDSIKARLPQLLQAGWFMITSIVSGIANNLPNILTCGIRLIFTLINGMMEVGSHVVSTLWDIAKEAFWYVVDHPEEVMNAITTLATNVANWFKETFFKIFNTLGDEIGKFFERANNFIHGKGWTLGEQANDGMQQGFGDVDQTLTDKLLNSQAETSQQAAFDKGQGLGEQAVAGMEQGLNNVPQMAADAGQQSANNLTTGLADGINNDTSVQEACSHLANVTIQFDNDQLVGAANGLIDTLVNQINARAGEVSSSMGALATNALNQLKVSFQTLPEDIPNTIATAMNGVIEIVSARVQEVCNVIKNNLTTAKNEADTATYQLSEAIKANFTTAETSINASMQRVKTDVSSNYDELRTTVIEKLGAIEGANTAFSTTHMAQFAIDVGTHAKEVIKVYEDMDKDIRDIISGLVQYFSVSGVNMMTGLEAGLESKRADVNSKTSSIVTDLRNTFEGGLGIHSPSEWGKWIGEMLALGIILGLSGSKLDQFVSTTINDMQAAFNAGGTHFNPAETVDFLSEQGALDLIGRVSGLDMSNINPETIAYPLIGTMGTQTSWFGPRVSPGGIGSTNHAGIDLAAPTGTPIAAALGGNVTVAGSHGGYGNAVVIDSGNGIDITYGHMSKVLTSVGTSVGKGQTIGLVGSTGNSTGPHLHFEMHQNGHKIDPQPYIEGASISAGNTLEAVLRNAYNAKYHPELLIASSMGVGAEGGINWQPDAGVAQWTATVQQALGLTGQPLTYTNDILYAIERESSGDPNKINNWDSNAAIGQNSRGLMQVIPDTFAAYAMPGLNTNIYDPLSNITAAIRYILSRYGNIPNMVNPRRASRRGWYGYAVGTRNVPEDMLAQIHKGEAIIPASQNPYRDSGGDYLGDLFSNVISNNSLEGLKLRDKTAGSTNYDNSSVNNNNNIVFNVYNNSDTDGDRFIGNLESELHRIFTDGQRVGTPR